MSANREFSPDDCAKILDACLAALSDVEDGNMRFDEPGQYPDEEKTA